LQTSSEPYRSLKFSSVLTLTSSLSLVDAEGKEKKDEVALVLDLGKYGSFEG
jgi:hypothetical protein